ncbi:relaxase/mobilization nuclease domain-containing protein [Yoonia sp. F2084L]|uniref:relaxase/mobilization nuclease domain-containing protein n=1 Tax=Yoonia sp. F2084L TaxID=2926419 RepID=UPI001FF46838|nr:relaxase/mobilization nuclease domain-containing protein [Yoonia sp. F2084L]MCK0096112.1 relaxase/mobilization nuclease domain-containing protein [Yoonia sp. F2084L]
MDRAIIQMPPEMVAALRQIAGDEDTSVDVVIRGAIKRDLYRRTRAKSARRADEQLVAPLRALLADDLAYANGWDDLQARLSRKGYELREAGGGLALHDTAGARLCKGSDLGYSYTRLMRRFGAPFPGHSHRYLYTKQLDEQRARLVR